MIRSLLRIPKIVSASSMKHYFLKDPFSDYLERFPAKVAQAAGIPLVAVTQSPQDNFMTFLTDRGHNFEADIIRQITKKIGKNNVKCITTNDPKDTYEAILTKVPVIYQGYLVCQNRYKGAYGHPDLIIRTDYLCKLFPDTPGLSSKDTSYRIIDIKSGRLNLCADGRRIRNSQMYPAYKGQVIVYNQALGDLQGKVPNTVYILGNGYKYESKDNVFMSDDPFSRLGEIQLDGWDKPYVTETDRAVEWYTVLDRSPDMLKISPTPNREELYPNMTTTGVPTRFDYIKSMYAEKIGELTMLWNIGPKRRKIAHDKGVYSWKSKKCKSSTFNLTGHVADIIDRMVKIQQDPNGTLMVDNSGYHTDPVEVFIDFETVQAPFIPHTFIYMIGVYIVDHTRSTEVYKCFTADSSSDRSQFKLLDQFYRYLHEYGFPKMYHWSPAEVVCINKVLDRLYSTWPNEVSNMYDKFKWYDLMARLKADKLVVKGAFGYSLKDITNALYNLGLVSVQWPESSCSSGTDAILAGYIHYFDPQGVTSGPGVKTRSMKLEEVRRYNEIDCIAMYEILSAVRYKCI